MNNPLTSVDLFTDGACRGNPGPGGWGAMLRHGAHEKRLSGYSPLTTNNRMEMLAAIRALEALRHPCEVALYTDSQYLCLGMREWIHGWRKKGWRTADGKPVRNKDLWQNLERLCQEHRVTFHWVRGHAGHLENEEVDRLAREAVALGQSGSLALDPLGSAPAPEPVPSGNDG